MLPNFLIIGAPRSATTLLKVCLEEHPEVYMASVGGKYTTGDVHFFNVATDLDLERHHERGLVWYESLFAAVTTERAIGEKTAHYLRDPEAPRIMAEVLPSDTRFIAVLRDPVRRAYSDYMYHLGELPLGMSFLDACFSAETRQLLLLDAGMYGPQIDHYYHFFDRSRFHFLLYEDLRQDVLSSVQKIFAFLQVDSTFVPAAHNLRVNSSRIDNRLSYYLKLLGGQVKRRAPGLFIRAKQTAFLRRLEDRIERDGNSMVGEDKGADAFPISHQDYEHLAAYYLESNARTSELIGMDVFARWRMEENERPTVAV